MTDPTDPTPDRIAPVLRTIGQTLARGAQAVRRGVDALDVPLRLADARDDIRALEIDRRAAALAKKGGSAARRAAGLARVRARRAADTGGPALRQAWTSGTARLATLAPPRAPDKPADPMARPTDLPPIPAPAAPPSSISAAVAAAAAARSAALKSAPPTTPLPLFAADGTAAPLPPPAASSTAAAPTAAAPPAPEPTGPTPPPTATASPHAAATAAHGTSSASSSAAASTSHPTATHSTAHAAAAAPATHDTPTTSPSATVGTYTTPARWLEDRKTQMTIGIGSLAIAGMAVALAAAPPTGAAPTPGSAAFGEAVRAYILEHPEIIPEAVAKLQQRDTDAVLTSNRAALQTPFSGAWAGAANGDVVLVEFTDYACGFCRASVRDIDRLIAEDPKLKIVYREIPILGAGSEQAATLALAAARQGRHAAIHRALFAAGSPSDAKSAQVIAAARLDPAAVARDRADPVVAKEIADNLALARTIGLTGTPTFVVGNRILSGAVGYDTLKQAIADARKG
ncbi:DsbA family protein [Sphingomonas arantia]|uniref:DsbA family protein n=1 Tax=Sphingomonas arantia TaxID=1460676 RepID=A0ABW4TZK7_9SPHN